MRKIFILFIILFSYLQSFSQTPPSPAKPSGNQVYIDQSSGNADSTKVAIYFGSPGYKYITTAQQLYKALTLKQDKITLGNSSQYFDGTLHVRNFPLPTVYPRGSVIFSNGTTLASDSANFFWDITNKRLGISTRTPVAPLTISPTLTGTPSDRGTIALFPSINATSSAITTGLYISAFTNNVGGNNLIDVGFNSAPNGTGTHTSTFQVTGDGRVIAQTYTGNAATLSGLVQSSMYLTNGNFNSTNTTLDTHGQTLDLQPSEFATHAYDLSTTVPLSSTAYIGINKVSENSGAQPDPTITVTNANSLYIDGAPIEGHNVVMTNKNSLYVRTGASFFGGVLRANLAPVAPNDVVRLSDLAGIGSYTFNNGLTNTAGTVGLGGSFGTAALFGTNSSVFEVITGDVSTSYMGIAESSTIESMGYFTAAGEQNAITFKNNISKIGYANLSANTLTEFSISSGRTFYTDNVSNDWIQYNQDYSAKGKLSNSSIPDWGAVKAYADSASHSVGSGTVSSVSVATANGVSGTVANPTTTPAIILSLGAITPTSTNGVSAATMAFNDATSSIQTQLNGKLNTTSNASSATKLQTARTINGTSFDGTENITITANTTNTLTNGYAITGSGFNGSATVIFAVDSTLQASKTWALAAFNTKVQSATSLSQATFLKQNSGVIYFGDSITSHGDDGTGSENWGYTTWFDLFTGGKFYRPVNGNQGVSGNTTVQMVARLGVALATKPALLLFLGGTNDITSGFTTASIQTNITTIVNAQLANGGKIIISTILPRFSPNALTAPQETQRQALNTWILSNFVGINNVYTINMETPMNSTTLFADGLHPNSQGALILGQGFATVANTFIDPTNVALNTTQDNALSANVYLTGTSGGLNTATGTVPTSYTLSASSAGGATTVGSITNTNGLNQAVMTLSGTYTSTTGTAGYSDATITTGFNVGDLQESILDFEVLSPMTNIVSVGMLIQYLNASSTVIASTNSFNPFDRLPTSLSVGRYQVRGVPFQVPVGCTQIVIRALAYFASGTSLPISASIKFHKMALKTVGLGTSNNIAISTIGDPTTSLVYSSGATITNANLSSTTNIFPVLIDNVLSKTADYTIVAGDFVAGKKSTLDLYVDATIANTTITLPSAVTFKGYTIYITKTDAGVNTVTVNTMTGNNVIAIAGTKQINSDGTVWRNH